MCHDIEVPARPPERLHSASQIQEWNWHAVGVSREITRSRQTKSPKWRCRGSSREPIGTPPKGSGVGVSLRLPRDLTRTPQHG